MQAVDAEDPLAALAHAAGIERDWIDAHGRPQRVGDDSLYAILAALGLPADSRGAIGDSRARIAEPGETAPLLVVDAGRPAPLGSVGAGHAELLLEDGSRRPVAITAGDHGGMLEAIGEPGYHRLRLADRELTIAVAPARCRSIVDQLERDRYAGRGGWAPAVQISALRGSSTHGDFTLLADAARHFARAGAEAMAISPTHALFPGDPTRYSPYAPSRREFHTILLAAPGPCGGPASSAGGELIDWDIAYDDRMTRLRNAFAARSDAEREAVAAFAAQRGPALIAHARFEALQIHFHRRSGARGWPDWPAAYHDPEGAAVAAFAAAHDDDIAFALYTQWLADRGLAEAQAAARDGGMAIGLIADVAVGIDRGGSHGWAARGDLLDGLSIGAPPDPLGPLGQNWGITGFAPTALIRTGYRPFIATLRAAMRHAGGIRIDHAFGLQRLWVVPDGADAGAGAYLTMPRDDLLRLIALESQRAGAIVIGEDLGTVPGGFRDAMQARGIAGMRVLWFERDAGGDIPTPERWPGDAVAMTGTHDLPTVAGWWRGRDIDWAVRLGRGVDPSGEAALRELRTRERTDLWKAIGPPGEEEPPVDEPDRVVDAALAFVASTPCPLAIIPLEDLLGLEEQPNLPGTVDEHPNWRRRMPTSIATLLADATVQARIAALRNRSTFLQKGAGTN
jgi:4-alpha-glucanotransferase